MMSRVEEHNRRVSEINKLADFIGKATPNFDKDRIRHYSFMIAMAYLDDIALSLAIIADAMDKKDIQPERKTGRWIETEGLDEEIRCTMCTNPMRSDRGCDGSCQYDEKLYKRIMSIIKDRIDGGGA